MNQWGYTSWWYWNQQSMELAVNMINNDPTILPNTTIHIKRFSNNRPNNRTQAANPGRAMMVAQEIVEHHQDVIAVFGDFYPSDMLADGQVYSYYQIPQCTGSTKETSMWSRNKYGYYFQTYAITGYAESIGLLLQKWNVKRIALIELVPFTDPSSIGGYFARVLESLDFNVLAKIVVTATAIDFDYLIQTLSHVDARYIIMSATPDIASEIYFGLAHRNRFVGKEYVWFMDNMPIGNVNGVEKWGPDYFKKARGIMTTFGANLETTHMIKYQETILNAVNEFQAPWGTKFTLESMLGYFNIVQLFSCPMIFAHGLHNLLKDTSLTPAMAASRGLQGLMNSTLFRNTGFRGSLGDPVQLTQNGDLATSYYLLYYNGENEETSATVFAITDVNVTRIDYLEGAVPIFFDGTSIPPPDGPLYTTRSITADSSEAAILKFWTEFGLILTGSFLVFIWCFRTKSAVRSGSVLFLSTFVAGSAPAYISNMLYIGMPSVFKCYAATWLQLITFVVMLGSLICKNLRIVLIYGSKAILPKYAVKDWFWLRFLGVFVFLEVILLGLWSFYSRMSIVKRELPGYVIEFTCIDESSLSFKFVAALWIYNTLVLLCLGAITIKSHNVASIHSEFTLLLVLCASLVLSAIIVQTIDLDDVIKYQFKVAGLIFMNTTLPLLLQGIPRVTNLIRAEFFDNGVIHLNKLKWNSLMSQIESELKDSERSFKSGSGLSVHQTTVIKATLPRNKNSFVKYSLIYHVVYNVKEFLTCSAWIRGGVSYGIVRDTAFLTFHPGLKNTDTNPVVISLNFQAGFSEKSVQLMEISYQNQKFERLVFPGYNNKTVILDFLVPGDGVKFKNGFVAAFEQRSKENQNK
ncbi:periplasmic binding protein-like I [Obelidium mucronatum]|nr:periplasmic binding protein-like I [Obelidium mucronatum]